MMTTRNDYRYGDLFAEAETRGGRRKTWRR